MPSTRVERIIKTMEYLKMKGFEKQAGVKDIMLAIAVNGAAMEKSKHEYFRMMQDLNVIRQSAPGVFELDYDEAGRLVFR